MNVITFSTNNIEELIENAITCTDIPIFEKALYECGNNCTKLFGNATRDMVWDQLNQIKTCVKEMKPDCNISTNERDVLSLFFHQLW